MTSAIASITFDAVETPWLWIIGVLIGAGILWITYRGIVQRSRNRLAWGLMVLRAVGLLALLLTLAKPTWTRERETIEPGRIAVIVDDSVSMTLPAGSQRREQRVPPALDGLRDALALKHGRKMILERYNLAGEPLPDDATSPTPQRERTDLARAIREVLSRTRSKPLAAVVLISDGADNSGRADVQDLAGLPVPVFTLGFAADSNPDVLDLSVRSPTVPPRALVNNEVKVDVPIRRTGSLPWNDVAVSLHLGDEVITTQTIAFPAGVMEQTISLKWTPKQAGTFHYLIKVESPTAEPILINNLQGFDLMIDGEPIRIVYIEGALRWESRYLLDQLRNDPDVQLESSIRIINPERPGARPTKELLTTERLAKTDIIILGDIDRTFLSDAEYTALIKWLEGERRSLLVLGGYRSFGADGWGASPLAAVLPVTFSAAEPRQREGRFTIGFTDDGRRHPIFELSGDREKDLRDWEQLGELEGLPLVGRAKPAATVLAVHPSQLIEDKPAIVAAFQPYGVGGKSMVLLADTTWRWSRLPRLIGRADTLYARFWSQTVRWLANRNVDDRRPLMRIRTDRPAYELGKPVQVVVTRTPPPGGSLANTDVRVECRNADGSPLLDRDGRQVVVPVAAKSDEPDTLIGSFTPATGGRYQLQATLTGDGKLLANPRCDILVQSAALELTDPRPNPNMLEAIARISGGKSFDIAQADQVIAEIPLKERRTVRTDRTEYWNSPWLFLLFIGTITWEWFTRRRNHMV